jgi:hypothetical protein
MLSVRAFACSWDAAEDLVDAVPGDPSLQSPSVSIDMLPEIMRNFVAYGSRANQARKTAVITIP